MSERGVDGRLRREMGDVGALLHAAGATLVVAAITLPSWDGMRVVPLVGVVTIAYITSIGLAIAVRRVDVPFGAFPVLNGLGSALIAVAVVFAGPQASGSMGLLYVFVAAYAFYYFPAGVAAFEMLIAAASYAIALLLLDVEGAVAQWTLTVATAAVGGGLTGRLGHRTRQLLATETAAAERLRELDELKMTFLQAVSHELRTPLTNLHGYAVTLDRHHDRIDVGQRRIMLDRLVWNAERLRGLLVDLLDLDRLARGAIQANVSDVDLGEVVRDVVDHADLRDHPCNVDTLPVVVAADRPKVERIVENLLTNAVKHTPAGTSIDVRTRPCPEGGLIVVEDAGPGVPPLLRREIFEPFRHGPDALHAPSPGTGIGLALVARFAQLHGGRVWAEERGGGGARFNVVLPSHPPTGDRVVHTGYGENHPSEP